MNTKIRRYWIILLVILSLVSCSEKTLDEIDTDPNNPADVSVKMLMPVVTSGVPYYICGSDLAWYSSVMAEQTAGTLGSLYSIDQRQNINSTLSENVWRSLYTGVLMDLNTIIQKSTEQQMWHHAGVAQVLMAFTMQAMTDTWGRVPFSQAFNGNTNRKPIYDYQFQIYDSLQGMLDAALVNLNRTATIQLGSEDLLYAGNTSLWTKAAYGLKARLYNRLGKVDPTYFIYASVYAEKSFADQSESLIFDKWTGANDIDHQNPWYRAVVEVRGFSISTTFYNILNTLQDPRINYFFTPPAGGTTLVPATNGSASEDINGTSYSKISDKVIYADVPLPLITWEEIKFIEAEANLNLSKPNLANLAYEQATISALTRYITEDEKHEYLGKGLAIAFPGQSGLTLTHIYRQKLISFWPFQSIEAYAEVRRNDYPTMLNPLSQPPLRFPYPQSEISANGANIPQVSLNNGVGWDDGTDD